MLRFWVNILILCCHPTQIFLSHPSVHPLITPQCYIYQIWFFSFFQVFTFQFHSLPFKTHFWKRRIKFVCTETKTIYFCWKGKVKTIQFVFLGSGPCSLPSLRAVNSIRNVVKTFPEIAPTHFLDKITKMGFNSAILDIVTTSILLIEFWMKKIWIF